MLPFLKLSNVVGGDERGDGCVADICAFEADIDAIGSIVFDAGTISTRSMSLIIGWFTLSTILILFVLQQLRSQNVFKNK